MSHHSEDEEDDYMSTKFLETAQEFESKRQESYSEKRKRQLREQQAKAYIKPRAQLEAEEREKGLQKSIEQSNKGMKMLMKMGFKQGQGLGSNRTSGIAEPIQVDLKLGRSGIGMDSEMRKREREQEEEELRKRVHIDPEEFRNQMASKAKDAQLVRYINAAVSICEKLDEENQVESNILWTLKPPPPPTVASTEPEDIEQLQQQELEKEKEEGGEDKKQDEPEEPTYPPEDVEALKSLPVEDQLTKLVDYLRETYYYCFWCRAKYTDQADLDENCPGTSEDDH